jgi:hypothetical protein
MFAGAVRRAWLILVLSIGVFPTTGGFAAAEEEDGCCAEVLETLLQAQSLESRDRFRELRRRLQLLDGDDFTWLQITAASDEPICRLMDCNGLAESVAKQLIALQALEHEAATDSRFAAQDRKLNAVMAVMTGITTMVGLGSLCVAFLAYRRSSRRQDQSGWPASEG